MASGESTDRSGVRESGILAWLRLARVFQKVDRRSATTLRPWALSVAQFDVLVQIGAHEGLSQRALATALMVTKGNVTQLLDRLERDGLIQRCQEGRRNSLMLTAEGRRLVTEVAPAQEAMIAGLFATLSPDDRRHLLSLLRRLDHAIA